MNDTSVLYTLAAAALTKAGALGDMPGQRPMLQAPTVQYGQDPAQMLVRPAPAQVPGFQFDSPAPQTPGHTEPQTIQQPGQDTRLAPAEVFNAIGAPTGARPLPQNIPQTEPGFTQRLRQTLPAPGQMTGR